MKDIAKIPIQNPAILAETDEADVTAEDNIIEIVDEENKQAEQNELNWMTNKYFNLDSSIIEIMLVQFIFIAFNVTSHFEKIKIETEEIKSMKNGFIKPAILNELKNGFIKPAILNELKNVNSTDFIISNHDKSFSKGKKHL